MEREFKEEYLLREYKEEKGEERLIGEWGKLKKKNKITNG